jgi:PAS domain S-box-containing protein
MRAGWFRKILQRLERSVWAVLLVGVAPIVLLAYSAYTWKVALQSELPILEQIDDTRVDLSGAQVRMTKLEAGDTDASWDEVSAGLDRSRQAVRSCLQGRSPIASLPGVVPEDAALVKQLQRLQEALTDAQTAAEAWREARGDAGRLQALKQPLDDVFAQAQKQADELDRIAHGRMARMAATPGRVLIISISLWVVVLAAACRGLLRARADRKQAEENLERERRQLLSIFDNIDEPVYVADPNTHELLYVNEAFRKQWGEGVGRKCHEVFQGQAGPCSFCTNDRIFGANIGQPYVWEFQNRTNGLWYRCIDKAIEWPDGRIVRYEMAIDITERKRAELALKDSEEQFRTLAENVPGVVYLCRNDRRHTMIYVSESVQELTGVSAAEFVSGGVSFADLYHPDDAAGIGPGVDAAVAEKRQFVLVYRLKHADGRWRWVEERGRGVFAEDGELRFLEGALTDITERKQAEKALRRERDFAEGLIETAQCIVLVLDLEGRILRFNPYLEEICGCSLDVVQGADWYATFVPEAERDRARLAFRQTLGDIRTPGLISPIRTQDGREREIEWNSRTLKDESGRTVGLLAVGQDITERKRAAEVALQRQAELAHVHRLSMMGELATGLAHELNQPLCAVSTCVQTCLRLMKVRPESLSEVTEGLEEAVAQAERAGEIIRRLRNFVRKHEPMRLPAVLSDVIKEAVAGVRAEARRCGIAIKLELAEKMPSVPVDSVQIQQVLLNLVRNSIEAIKGAHGRPGEIRIEARPADGQVEVVVRDTGPGLPAEALEKVFESFYTTKPYGLGLGLPLSRSFIEAHGGRLWATPNSDGGVAFRFTLPLNTGANTDGSRTDRIRRG